MSVPLSSDSTFNGREECFRILMVFILFAVVFSSSTAAYAWGPQAHRLADDWAIGTLPAGLRTYFVANRTFILDHANDPEKWIKKDRFEKMRQYIFLNKYGMFPYRDLPHNYRAAVRKYGLKHITRNGVLPWQIGEYSLKLTNAFKSHDWQRVKLNGAALAYYVADAHDPLHTTQNYNGQLTGQDGLERRFGTDLVERYSHFFMYRPDSASNVDDPTEYAFKMILESHTWVDQIILADLEAQNGSSGYTDDYFDRFYSQVGSTAMKEISEAAHDIGSYWYSAWLYAGSPEMPRQ